MNLSRTIVLIASICGTACVSLAQPLRYDVSHSFTFNPPAGFPAVVPTVTGHYFEHAWIKDYYYQAWGAAPLPQGPAFEPFGYDSSTGTGAMNYMPPAGPASPVNFQAFTIPPLGVFTTGCISIISPNSNLWAVACTQFDVAPFGAGTPVQGTFRSAGGVNMGGIGRVQEAYAFSSAGISIQGVAPTGQVLWHATLTSVSGSVHRVRVTRDPVKVTALDAAGNTASATALDIDFQNSGPGGVDWQSNVLSVDALDSRFIISMDPIVAPRGGNLLIETHGGVVTQTAATGRFAGMILPPIGSPVPYTMALSNDIPVDYNASNLLPGATSANLDFMGGGSMPEKIGCAADFNGDRVLDFFDYLDFVDSFSSGLDGADFNQDGEIDFFDYLDFVDAFSAGC